LTFSELGVVFTAVKHDLLVRWYSIGDCTAVIGAF